MLSDAGRAVLAPGMRRSCGRGGEGRGSWVDPQRTICRSRMPSVARRATSSRAYDAIACVIGAARAIACARLSQAGRILLPFPRGIVLEVPRVVFVLSRRVASAKVLRRRLLWRRGSLRTGRMRLWREAAPKETSASHFGATRT
jgi:hypothetical protein